MTAPPRAEVPELALVPNVPVIVTPTRARYVHTQHGDRIMLQVQDGGETREVKWLPVNAANQLVAAGAAELGTWPDGNPKITVRRDAPALRLVKSQGAGEKHATLQIVRADAPEAPGQLPSSATNGSADPLTVDAVIGRALKVAERLREHGFVPTAGDVIALANLYTTH